MDAQEIIEKLEPTLRHEGLEVELLGQEEAVVNIRARRIGPGVPVAFLVKAIAGTFRRYLPEVKDVCLVEYDPGEGIGTAASPTFDQVFAHRPGSSPLALRGFPVLDLNDLDRRDAVRALEGFFKVWGSRIPAFAVVGLEQDGPQRATGKWAQVYRQDYREKREVSADRWEFSLSDEVEPALAALCALGEERMPGRIFLTSEESAT